ncbi:zinc finger BED domain-containing protein 5-like [Melanaphis sacchari]|uniref:zinc finger BED domain-containing protein 5-like n=1 Tax=Melanaphis sacchari TaxID=742174 RepID=UPI000DC158C4|nr:zinc finger BED domain-containing protein 5-like [Melanaphis sacchari]XP_025202738.1 zinc finger BED domain-containing protein 5-like [Melanaphis sacchari]
MDRFITRTSKLIESSPSTSGTSKQSKDSPSTSGTLKMSGNSPSTARPSKQSKGKCRLYDESYISIGFTWCGPEDEPIPECIICGKTFTNESMVPNKLNRHFIKQHFHLKCKDIHYFKRPLSCQKKEAIKFTKKVKISERALEASFVVSQMIANNMKAHTIGENLIKPAGKEMVRIMIGDEAALEIDKIPMSNDTITRRINDMSVDIKQHTVEKMKLSRFTLQVDDSTVSDGKCYMIGFVRFVVGYDIINQFLCLKEEALMTKTLGSDLNSILINAVRIVNYIKRKPLKSKIFAEICNSMDAGFTNLLYHTEVRWLSRGKVLARLYELKEELLLFFMEEGNEEFTINSSLQGPLENVSTSTDKLSAFQEKISIWCTNLDQGKTAMFPLFTSQENSNPEVLGAIRSHLQALQMSLKYYFPDLNVKQYDWVRNPFTSLVQTDDCELQQEAVELKNDRTLQLKFKEMSLNSFWVSLHSEYPRLSTKVIEVLLQFSTSWLCEHGFSALTNIKTKKRQRLTKTTLEDDMRLALSTINP